MRIKVLVIGLLLSMGLWAAERTTESVQETPEVSSVMPCYYAWQHVPLDASKSCMTLEQDFHFKSMDRGIFGAKTKSARIYCDITMPVITSECLVDIGAAMSHWGGLLGQCPKWFTMFDPGACPRDELFGAAKANTAIMLTMRTYF